MHWAFGKNLELRNGDYGNGILTRFPIVHQANLYYKMVESSERRGLLQVVIDVNNQEIVFTNTHIDHHLDNAESILNVKQIRASANAYGGKPVIISGDFNETPESRMIEEMEWRIEDREQQLRLLDQLASSKRLEDELYLEGRPITWGWLSSKYGYRSDPFTGKRTWHAGVDLAGKDGSDIISVAGGVVTYAGERYGYGNLVEVDHGDGLITRYAHCKTIKVKVGDVVQKGQVVALMGSTGRSTGPHVHFEVIRNGKSENPETYIKRASR